MLNRVNKLPAGTKIKSKYGKEIVYLYAINGKAVAYVDSGNKYAKFKSKTGAKVGRYAEIHAPSQVISACFRKAGFEMSAGGKLFVPMGYRKATGRTTFRGMSLKQIKTAQKKY